jgi:hypothetical protein
MTICVVYVLHVVHHPLDECAGWFACPKCAVWKFELIDGRIVDFDRIAWFKWCTIEASLNTRWISKIFYVVSRVKKKLIRCR